jgi:hypothetical protein
MLSALKALSGLFKAITCLPTDVSLISLPPGPLLELTCTAAQCQLTSVRLSLVGMLMGQLNPPSVTMRSLGPTPEAENPVLNALPMLLEPCFAVLNSTQAMEAVGAGAGIYGRHALTAYRGRVQTLLKCFSLAWKWCVGDVQSLTEGYVADLSWFR